MQQNLLCFFIVNFKENSCMDDGSIKLLWTLNVLKLNTDDDSSLQGQSWPFQSQCRNPGSQLTIDNDSWDFHIVICYIGCTLQELNYGLSGTKKRRWQVQVHRFCGATYTPPTPTLSFFFSFFSFCYSVFLYSIRIMPQYLEIGPWKLRIPKKKNWSIGLAP